MGLTLIEFIVTMAILAVTLSLAAPSFRTAILDSRMTTQVNEFIGSLIVARSEAVRRGVPVSMCKADKPFGQTSANNPRFRCNFSGTVDWEDGRIVFVDTDRNGRYGTATGQSGSNAVRAAGEDILLRVYEGLEGGATLRAQSAVNAEIAKTFTYTPEGFARSVHVAGEPVLTGYFVFCDERGFGPDTRAVIIGPTGRPRSVIKREDDELPVADREFARFNITGCTP